MPVGFGFILCVALSVPSAAASGHESAKALVQRVVRGELAADAADHSRWMFRDANKVPGNDTVKLTVQTSAGDISKTILIDGHPLSAQQQQDDEAKMRQFVTDPSVRQKQKEDQQQDGAKARSLTEMLPNAFLWTVIGRQDADTTLAFTPDPNFSPPTREARVFAAMKGKMVVNTLQNRIVSLQGVLTEDIDFGFGILGKLDKGGTFDVQRSQVGPDVWEITSTHVHIQGHMLIFKSINEQQDEETGDYKPAPPRISLPAAAKMLNDGAVGRELGIAQP
jgi:hypothetical protein